MTDQEWERVFERIDAVAAFKPYAHQRVGIRALVDRPYFLLADEMGSGKSLTVVDAQQILYHYGIIDTVIVVAPAAVRDVWFDSELGELKKHLWPLTSAVIYQFHAQTKVWKSGPASTADKKPLTWVITNYDYIRGEVVTKQGRRKIRTYPRLDEGLDHFCGAKTTLVLDESSAVKAPTSAQSRACENLRERCGRVILLNGTPIANSPGDLYQQGLIMHPSILECDSFFHFKARYAELGGYNGKQPMAWRNIDELQRRFAPHVLRRLKEDCLDLPPKLPPVVRTVALTPETWKHYREMRDHLVTWLGQVDMSLATQAIVKVIRLSQITAGFIGGVKPTAEPTEEELRWQAQFAEIIDVKEDAQVTYDELPGFDNVRILGSEKIDSIIEMLHERYEAEPNYRFLMWAKYRPEVTRLYEAIATEFPRVRLGKIWGMQKREERTASLRLLDPRTVPPGPVGVIGTAATGAMGLNLTAAWSVTYVTNDYSLKIRLQSEDRVHRPGQTRPVDYTDLVATGPKGQKTIDHVIIKALRAKDNLANWTMRAWRHALEDEAKE